MQRKNINEHFLDITKPSDYSNQSAVSRAFKKLIGSNITDFLIKQRVYRAKVLLLEGRSVREVGEMVGYSSPYTITKNFKDLIGKTPIEFKKESRLIQPH